MPNVQVRPISLRGGLAVLLVASVFAMTAAPAMAISGSASQGNVAEAEYPPPKVADTDTVSGGGSGDGDGIPFSGFALVTLAGLGLLTLTGGFALRRASRTSVVE